MRWRSPSGFNTFLYLFKKWGCVNLFFSSRSFGLGSGKVSQISSTSFSSKKSALAKRFSDEFSRSFHLATDDDRGYTKINNILDDNFQTLNWKRDENQVDILEIELETPILPKENKKINLLYTIKLPNEKFSRYGFNDDGKLYLKNIFLFPAAVINFEKTDIFSF